MWPILKTERYINVVLKHLEVFSSYFSEDERPLAVKEITPDKGADSVNEKWPENLACCHKRIYLNACAVHNSFPLKLFL